METFKMYKNLFKLEQKRGRFSAIFKVISQMPMPSTKTRTFFGGFAQFLHEFLPFEIALTYNDVQRGCHDVFRGHQKAKIRAKIARNHQKTAAFLSMALPWHACSLKKPRKLRYFIFAFKSFLDYM
jgi:hypothetical protein